METVFGQSTYREPKGAVLSKGAFVLTLCSGCEQASGVEGGRFSEIAALVQPWARKQEPAEACGRNLLGATLGKITRRDLVYGSAERRRPFARSVCVMPKDLRPRWYGSYYAPTCSKSDGNLEACDAFFLDLDELSAHPQVQQDAVSEIAFGLTFATHDVNELPVFSDPALKTIQREADAIVRSICYK